MRTVTVVSCDELGNDFTLLQCAVAIFVHVIDDVADGDVRGEMKAGLDTTLLAEIVSKAGEKA